MSPFSPSMETVGPIIIKAFVPYNEEMVTLQINPAISDYEDVGSNSNENIKIRQIVVTQSNEDTRTIKLDVHNNSTETVEFNGEKFEVKLLSIGKVKKEGQDFPVFDLLVTQL